MAKVLSPGDVNRHVGMAVEVARQARQMTVEQLAAAIGLSPERLRRIEDGSEEASVVDMHLIARALNIDVSAFFFGLDHERGDGDSDGSTRRLVFPDLLNATIGARIRRVREATGLSAAALAMLSELRTGRILRIESGRSEAAASELFAIARVLGVAVSFFFDGRRHGEDEAPRQNGSRFGVSTAAA
jgi:transcriptional regulator with XRE-family HTH domain